MGYKFNGLHFLKISLKLPTLNPLKYSGETLKLTF